MLLSCFGCLSFSKIQQVQQTTHGMAIDSLLNVERYFASWCVLASMNDQFCQVSRMRLQLNSQNARSSPRGELQRDVAALKFVFELCIFVELSSVGLISFIRVAMNDLETFVLGSLQNCLR